MGVFIFYLLKTEGSTQALQDILGQPGTEHGNANASFLASHPHIQERINNLASLESR